MEEVDSLQMFFGLFILLMGVIYLTEYFVRRKDTFPLYRPALRISLWVMIAATLASLLPAVFQGIVGMASLSLVFLIGLLLMAASVAVGMFHADRIHQPLFPMPEWRNPLLFAVAGTLYTWVLFTATDPQLTELGRRLISNGEQLLGTGWAFHLQIALVAAQAAISEEMSFRFLFTCWLISSFHLKGKMEWLAIGLATVVWTTGHSGILDPNWIKLAQIAPLGIGLGWIARREGILSAILAHLLFNAGALAISYLFFPHFIYG